MLSGSTLLRHLAQFYCAIYSQRKTLILSDSIELQDTNGLICIYLNRLNTLKTWRLSGFGLTIMFDLTQPLAVSRQDG